MQTSQLHSVSDLGPTRQPTFLRERLRVHRGGLAPLDETRPVADASPLHSVQTFAATMFVMSAAACWLAVAAVATAPILGAGELLTRVTRSPGN
jgi:hypothetical protein